MDLNLHGKVAFVAGSSNGIGLSVVTQMHAEGASVVITGRTSERVEKAATTLRNLDSSRVLTFVGDLATTAGAHEALQATLDRFHRLDIVIGCIGDGQGRLGWSQGAATWSDTFGKNLWPAIRLCEEAIPILSEQPTSSVVLVGSISGRERMGPIAYGTAKAALAAYSSKLAAEVASMGIRVNCVEPGNVLVPGGRWQERLQEEPERINSMLEREVLLKRFGTPEEIASVITFLASERSSFVTAARIVVDGGQTRD